MDKRLIMTIAMCMLVLLAWSTFVSKTQPVANKEVASKLLQQPAAVQQPVNELVATVKQALPQIHEKVKLPNEEIDFSVGDATINEVLFKEHKNYTFPLVNSFLINDKSLNFKTEASGPKFVTFVHSDPEIGRAHV